MLSATFTVAALPSLRCKTRRAWPDNGGLTSTLKVSRSMKFPEHVTLSFLIAQFGVQQDYGSAGTVLVVLAGNLPDLDSLTVLGGWRFYRAHHRVIGHGLPVTLCGPVLLAAAGSYFGVAPFG